VFGFFFADFFFSEYVQLRRGYYRSYLWQMAHAFFKNEKQKKIKK